MIAAGLGCRAACPVADLVEAVRRALADSSQALSAVQALYSGEIAATATLRAAADELGKPLVLLSRGALEAQASRALTHSPAVTARLGLPSLAETAALAGAFELGAHRATPRLLSARCLFGAAACALACVEIDA